MCIRDRRIDIWRMAEAMTRHTGEVDVYHIGPNAGLGSRHNVCLLYTSSKPRMQMTDILHKICIHVLICVQIWILI